MAKKEEEKKRNADEQFEMQNKMLDDQIAMKNKIKTILSPEQFEKWNSLKEKHKGKFQDNHRKKNHENCTNRERDDK